MKRLIIFACATAVSLAAFSSCSNDPTVHNGSDTTGANLTFHQLDRIGRPGLKELFIPYTDHDAFNRLPPTTDATQTTPLIGTFMSAAGRSSAITAYVEDLLTPDVLTFNVTDTSTHASYLGWETGGKIPVSCTGLAPNAFGGRGLSDDVVSAMLGLVYGDTATSTVITSPTNTNVFSFAASSTTTVAPPADDGKEQPGLANQNLGCGDKVTTSNTFPYLTAPI